MLIRLVVLLVTKEPVRLLTKENSPLATHTVLGPISVLPQSARPVDETIGLQRDLHPYALLVPTMQHEVALGSSGSPLVLIGVPVSPVGISYLGSATPVQ